MRKHRLYGVVLAMLLGVGVFTHSPISKHHQTKPTKPTKPTESTSPAAPVPRAELASFRRSIRRSPRIPGANSPSSASLLGMLGLPGLPGLNGDRKVLTASEQRLLIPYSSTRPRPGTSQVRDPDQIGWVELVLEYSAAVASASPPAPAAQEAAQAPPAQAPPAQAPPAQAPPAQAPPAQAPTASADDPWAALRQCESNGNYADDTGNGYYGAYQFSLSTWQSLGYSGLPSDAPPAEQDQAAQQLQSMSGWGQWPACASELGLT